MFDITFALVSMVMIYCVGGGVVLAIAFPAAYLYIICKWIPDLRKRDLERKIQEEKLGQYKYRIEEIKEEIKKYEQYMENSKTELEKYRKDVRFEQTARIVEDSINKNRIKLERLRGSYDSYVRSYKECKEWLKRN